MLGLKLNHVSKRAPEGHLRATPKRCLVISMYHADSKLNYASLLMSFLWFPICDQRYRIDNFILGNFG